jgi:hypothetical protein
MSTTLQRRLPRHLSMQSTMHLTLTHESGTILEYIKSKTINQKVLEKDNMAPISAALPTCNRRFCPIDVHYVF